MEISEKALVVKSEYIVAFANTAACGPHEGVITWSVYPSKADFDAWYTEDMRRLYRVVEEGISQERAVELVDQTPMACYMISALGEAQMPDGSFDRDIFEMTMANALHAKGIH